MQYVFVANGRLVVLVATRSAAHPVPAVASTAGAHTRLRVPHDVSLFVTAPCLGLQLPGTNFSVTFAPGHSEPVPHVVFAVTVIGPGVVGHAFTQPFSLKKVTVASQWPPDSFSQSHAQVAFSALSCVK